MDIGYILDIGKWILTFALVPFIRTVWKNEKRITALETESAQAKERVTTLEKKREHDLTEYNSALAIAKGLEGTVKTQFTEYLQQAREQRHQENQQLTEAFHKLDKTLEKVSVNLEHMGQDINKLKQKNGL